MSLLVGKPTKSARGQILFTLTVNPNDRQKSSQKPAVVQNQKAENQTYRGAGRNHIRRVNQSSKPKIRKADNRKTEGVIYNISIRLAYTESAQNNDQRSDGVFVYRLGYIYTGELRSYAGHGV